MSANFKNFGSRHKPGRTCVAFDSVNRRFLSAGSEGNLHVYTNCQDSSPLEFVVGEKVNFIISKGKNVILATEGSHVYIQQISDGLLEGIATRFTAGVNCLALNKDHSKLLAGGSDFIVKVVDLTNSDEGAREVLLKGHTGPILSVDFDPLDSFAASSSCDGTVRIWQLNDAREIKSIQVLLKCNDTELAPSPCRLKWHPSHGEFLVVPVDNFIRLYERGTWSFLRGLRCPQAEKPFTECEFSPGGSVLAGLSSDGWLVLWQPLDGTILHKIQDPSFAYICSMIWPEPSNIYYGDKHGAIGLISVDPSSFNQKICHAPITANGGLSPDTINALMDTRDGDDLADLLNIAVAQAEEEQANYREENDQERTQIESTDDDFLNDGDDNDDSNSIAISKIKSSYMVLNDDDNAMSDAPTSPTGTFGAMRSGPPQLAQATSAQVIPEIKAFQPGSMPSGFRERFLLWNRVGVVTRFANDDDDIDAGDALGGSGSGIQAEFHDTTLHHSLHLNNAMGFCMADLSLTALMLATTGSADVSRVDALDAGKTLSRSSADTELSTILVRPINTNAAADNAGVGVPGGASSAATADWFTSLPSGEACRAICLVSVGLETTQAVDPYCRGYAVVATSARLLRIFNQPAPSAVSSGNALRLLQTNALSLPLISLPGREVIVMASHPFLPILAVVVGWSNEDLYWRVFNLGAASGASGVARGWLFGQLSSTFYPLPLSPAISPSSLTPNASARLTWFGFSDTGNLFTHDASGVVRRLIHHRTSGGATDFHWVPICDTRRALKPQNRRSDGYFVVAIIESVKQVINAGGGNSAAAALLDGDGDEEVAPGEAEAMVQKIKSDALGYGQVQALYCKASKWPRVIPKPVVATLPFHIPLCGLFSLDQADLEENYLRTVMLNQTPFWGTIPNDEESLQLETLQNNSLNDKKRVLLRLFALATKLESDWASLTVANMMPDLQTVQLAIRYAARLGRQNLASRLGEVALRKEEEEEVDAEEEEEDGDDDDDHDDHRVETDRSIGNAHTENIDDDDDGSDAGEATGPSEGENKVSEDAPPSILAIQNGASILSEGSASQHSLDRSTQRGRLNPFKYSEGGTRSNFPVGGRGSSALDTLKPRPPPPVQPPTSSSSLGGHSTTGHGKRAKKTKSLAKSRTLKQKNAEASPPQSMPIGGKAMGTTDSGKRPPLGDDELGHSAAKRLSSFAFKENE